MILYGTEIAILQMDGVFNITLSAIRIGMKPKCSKFVKWVGKKIPTLDDEDSIVRIGQGIGQNMITPGDLTAEEPQEGDVPYAGTLTYTLNWQNFNRDNGAESSSFIGSAWAGIHGGRVPKVRA